MFRRVPCTCTEPERNRRDMKRNLSLIIRFTYSGGCRTVDHLMLGVKKSGSE
jgi:hypothetical protein